MSIVIVDMHSAESEQAFVQTLRHTGFAVLRNAPVDAARMQRMKHDWLDFFLGEEKQNYPAAETSSGNLTGYIPPSVSETAVGYGVKDLKEFFQYTPEGTLPPALADDVHAHLRETFALGELLLDWLDIDCDEFLVPSLRGGLANSLSAQDSLLRMLHYPPLVGGEPAGAVRAAAHEDINLLTLLPVSDQSGLQVQSRYGEWIAVPGEPGDIIINAGDMLQEATAGHLPSTPHRVINPLDASSNFSRVAMPYFLAPKLDVRLSERHTAGSYLSERLELLAR
ncbi:MAG: isopenicillin N synthase-like dioxygenase [Halieaceae bacterium]|jgi:isopenicillin N synthase-like dioxygenase